jgi:hypothetical protein
VRDHSHRRVYAHVRTVVPGSYPAKCSQCSPPFLRGRTSVRFEHRCGSSTEVVKRARRCTHVACILCLPDYRCPQDGRIAAIQVHAKWLLYADLGLDNYLRIMESWRSEHELMRKAAYDGCQRLGEVICWGSHLRQPAPNDRHMQCDMSSHAGGLKTNTHSAPAWWGSTCSSASA